MYKRNMEAEVVRENMGLNFSFFNVCLPIYRAVRMRMAPNITWEGLHSCLFVCFQRLTSGHTLLSKTTSSRNPVKSS